MLLELKGFHTNTAESQLNFLLIELSSVLWLFRSLKEMDQTNVTTASSLLPTSPSQNDIKDPLDSSPTIRGLFGTVAGLSLFSNMLLCVVMLRRREMLKKTYNILIFSLAITDTLTGKNKWQRFPWTHLFLKKIGGLNEIEYLWNCAKFVDRSGDFPMFI